MMLAFMRGGDIRKGNPPRHHRTSPSTDRPFPRRVTRFGGPLSLGTAMGVDVVVLDPDVAALFPTARAVNDALRKVTGLK